MSAPLEIDVVIVGAGPGGYVAAIRVAQHGLSVALVERDDRLGGRCLREACIPAKSVLRSAEVHSQVADAATFGVSVTGIELDFARVAARRDEVIGSLGDSVAYLMRKHDIGIVQGEASLTGDGQVFVDDRRLQYRRGVILAAGSIASPLPSVQFGDGVMDTREAWLADDRPESMAVIGAGASGAELASAFARLGTTVTLIDQAEQVLPGEDADVARVVHTAFQRDGIDLRLGVPVTSVDRVDGRLVVAGTGTPVEVDRVVVAAGRRPDVAGLGLAASGVAIDPGGRIEVDHRQETSRAGVYAIGDLCPGPALAHKASAEAIVAADAIAGAPVQPLDLDAVPRATFCMPNVASIGLTEAAARANGHDVVVGSVPYGSAGAATLSGDVIGLVKVISERTYGEILGAHVVGARAPEILQQLANVRSLEGGVAEVARIVHSHPALSELVSEAARAADGWVIHG